MPCPRCGQMNAPDAQVCVRCGQPLTPAPSQSQEMLPSASAIPRQAAPGLRPYDTPAPEDSATSGNVSPPPVSQGRAGADGRKQPGGNARQSPLPEFPCRVCGARVGSARRDCAICGTPLNMTVNPYDSRAATYFPAGYAIHTMSAAGSGGAYGRVSDAVEAAPPRPLPRFAARRRWHWGAFGLSTLWLLKHRLSGWGVIALALSLLSPLAYFGPPYLAPALCGLLLSLLLGAQGGPLAWQQNAYPDTAAYDQNEQAWKRAGLGGAAAKICLLLALTMLAFRH